MARSKEIEAIVSRLVSSLYEKTATQVRRSASGRLTDTFYVETQAGEHLFLKIAREIEDNTAFSTLVTKEGINLGFPFAKTHPGIDGQLFQKIPASWSDRSPVPDYLKGMTVTLVDYYIPPEPTPNTPQKFWYMGAYLGRYKKFNPFVSKHQGDIPPDLLSPQAVRENIEKTFGLEPGCKGEEADKRAKSLSGNLPVGDPIAAAFAESLKGNLVSRMLEELNELTKREESVRKSIPKDAFGLLNRDVKPNNLFFNPDGTIKLAFDLDMVTYGPLVMDLGRAIALSCFDSKTDQLNVELMQALIAGRIFENPLSAAEIEALPHYIELGIITSFRLRSSYFAEMLQGKEPAYTIDRLNPAIHAAELKSFREWNQHGSLQKMLTKIQQTQKGKSMLAHDVSGRLKAEEQFKTLQEKAPPVPNHVLLGPGPLTSWEMTKDEESVFRKEMLRYGFQYRTDDKGIVHVDGLEGKVHRNRGSRQEETTGIAGLFRDTAQLAKKVLGLPEASAVMFYEGGHNAANALHVNLFCAQPEIPVVAICNGGFSGDVWGHDLKTQYEAKGALDKVIAINVPDGETVTAEQIQVALRANRVEEGSPFNLTYTLNETSTSAAVPAKNIEEIMALPGLNTVIVDASSGIMAQDFPGKEKVSFFATSQKVLRGPTDHCVMVICEKDQRLLSKEFKNQIRFPLPKAVNIAPTECDSEVLKRSSNPHTCLELRHGLTEMLMLQAQGYDHIQQAKITNQHFQQAVEEHTSFNFFVRNPENRGNYNIVLVSTNAELNSLSPTQRELVMKEAHELLSDEERAIDVKPYGQRGDFRLTTLDIKSKKQARTILDNLDYAVDKALLKMKAKTFTLIAEDQFLYGSDQEVDEAIARKKQELAAKGITFIDARPGKDPRPGRNEEDKYTLLPPGEYVIYKPQLDSTGITKEYGYIQPATLQKTALIVAAKNVPAEAKFDMFVRQGAGVNNLPLDQAEKDGHVVMNCPGINTKVTSNHTLAAVVGDERVKWFSDMAKGNHASASNLKPLYGPTPEVDMAALNRKVGGKIVTVLGSGNIGAQTLLQLLKSEAGEVRVYSRTPASWGPQVKRLLEERHPKLKICGSIDEAMKDAHICINHLALVPGEGGTKDAVRAEHISKMADGAEIIDASRPGIINIEALIAAEQSGKLSRVVVDFDTPDKDAATENLFSHALKAENVWFSPHAFADADPKVREDMLERAIDQTCQARQGKVCNFAGLGGVPVGYEDTGKHVPEGIGPLQDYIKPIATVRSVSQNILFQVS